MPKVTNAFTTYQAKGNREDLADAIFNIDPVDTVFLSTSDTRSISNVMFDWQTEKLPAVNGSNQQVEGFVLNRAASTPTVRITNVAQISERDATVSGTQEAADAAGKNGEMAHQMSLAGKAIKRDMETALLGPQAYNAGADDTTARATRGLEHWITTNAFYGATGANPVSPTAPITDGTPRAFTEAILGDAIQASYDKGAEPNKLLMGSYIKRVFSTFLGRQQSRVSVGQDEIVASADFYASDFGEIKAFPSRYMRPRTVIGWDSNYSKIAYYRKMEKIDIGTIGDATTKMLLSEYGLQCSNEAAHFKIADLITSGPITMASMNSPEPRVVGGVMGPPATGETDVYDADGKLKDPNAAAPAPAASNGGRTFVPASPAPPQPAGSSPGTLSVNPTPGNPSEVSAKTPAGTKGMISWGDATADEAPKNGSFPNRHTYDLPGDYVVRLLDATGHLVDSVSITVPV